MLNIDKLDKRYKQTQDFLYKGVGNPVYKKRAFNYIDSILGNQYKWINKSPEEYFVNDKVKPIKVCRIFSFTGKESLSVIKNRYRKLSKGNVKENRPGFHPDMGGHESAFAILKEAYNVFKEAE